MLKMTRRRIGALAGPVKKALRKSQVPDLLKGIAHDNQRLRRL